ncbi:MAG: helix-turn-helix domain-containing protein [Gallionellaceae bacterium]
MEVIQFTTERLAKRWGVSTHTLQRWRTTGIGPTFLKLKGTVVYRECDIEAYEESCSSTFTRSVVAENVAA